jgi:hypothetical protein
MNPGELVHGDLQASPHVGSSLHVKGYRPTQGASSSRAGTACPLHTGKSSSRRKASGMVADGVIVSSGDTPPLLTAFCGHA